MQGERDTITPISGSGEGCPRGILRAAPHREIPSLAASPCPKRRLIRSAWHSAIFIRRIGLLTRRGHQLAPGGRRAQPARRQPGEATVAMRSSSAAHERAAAAHLAPARLPVESASEKPTVVARRAPVQAFEAPQPPPMAESSARAGDVSDRSRTHAAAARSGWRSRPARCDPRGSRSRGEAPRPGLGCAGRRGGRRASRARFARSRAAATASGVIPSARSFFPASGSHASTRGSSTSTGSSQSRHRATSRPWSIPNGSWSELHDGDYIKLGKTTLRFRSIL